MIPKSEGREGTQISLVIVHTNEGPHGEGLHPDLTAENLAKYLDEANAASDWKSYHVLCDDDSVVRYVPDDQAAWSALSANKRSLNLCFTGWAAWPRSEWLAHDSMLRLAAQVVAQWCSHYSIPVVKLTPAQVGADQRGICGHWDWTLGKHEGTHTDPGPNFPWDVFIKYVMEAELTDEQNAILHEIRGQLAGNQNIGEWPGWPARPDSTDAAKTLVDYVRALHAEQRLQHAMLESIITKLGVTG